MHEMQIKSQEKYYTNFSGLWKHAWSQNAIKTIFTITTTQNNSQKGNKHILNIIVKQNRCRKYGSGLSGQRASKLSYCNWIHSKSYF